MASKEKYNPAKALLANLPAPTGEDTSYWEKNLELTDKLRIVGSLRNVYLILLRDERWQGVIAFDDFANQVVKRRPPPYEGAEPGPWSDVDDLRTVIWLSQHYRFNAEKKIVMQAVLAVASDQRFHPVREYFGGLEWDRTPRLGAWLTKYLGAPLTQYTQVCGTKFLVGAVARVMRPGCRMDNVLILEGEQGRWKSSAIQALASTPWFSDTPFTIGDKDAFLQIRGTLIYELPELDGFTRAESSRAKAFFSSPYDTYVPKYVAWSIKVPRQCVFMGTVNHGAYLRDTTGNRRYWPVRVERADLEAIARDRDQIWAEAVEGYEAGVRWWVELDEKEAFDAEQDLRYVGDAYEDLIRAGLAGLRETTMEKILGDILKLELSKWTRAEQMRIGEIMQQLGWERRRRSGGKREYYYARREREPGEEG